MADFLFLLTALYYRYFRKYLQKDGQRVKDDILRFDRSSQERKNIMTLTLRLAVVFSCLALFLAACGGGDSAGGVTAIK
ncbi:MAG: hypothetical protein OXC68_10435 [Aestuariivita sp.]|nr:hypothetical protein [Aestuariivita sp.]